MCLAVVGHGQGAVLLLVQVGLVAAQGGSRQQGVSAGCTVGPPGSCVMCVMLCHVSGHPPVCSDHPHGHQVGGGRGEGPRVDKQRVALVHLPIEVVKRSLLIK